MVDRAAVALGAVASQSFPHRQSRLALGDRFADRLAVALADEPDRLAIRRAFFAVRLAVLPVARLVRSRRAAGSPALEYNGPAGAAPTGSSPAAGADGATVLRMRDVPVGSRRGRVSLAMGIHSPVQINAVSITGQDRFGEDGFDSFHLVAARNRLRRR